ncbi:MAG TPA: hypothetical protein VGP07_23380 [Polyangia bacterium]|jgi:hypothetical protein
MSARVVISLAIVFGCCLGTGVGLREASAASPVTGGTPRPGPSVTAPDSGEDIRDIHGPITLPARGSRTWLIAGAGVLAAATLGARLYWRRRRLALPPHQRALQALRDANELVGGDPRAFSVTVSEIVRAYVEEAFGVRAPRRTTDELLADLMQDASPVAAHRAALGQFLHDCDLAKFAAWSLSRADMAAMLASAETFVRATAPLKSAPHVPPAAGRGEGVAVA